MRQYDGIREGAVILAQRISERERRELEQKRLTEKAAASAR